MTGKTIDEILKQDDFSKDDLVRMLETVGDEKDLLFQRSSEIKRFYTGNKVWLRGLIEFSNVCSKDCLYCGIRKGNRNLKRYSMTDEEILSAAKLAYERGYGSLALQSGELESNYFTDRIENLIRRIKDLSYGQLGITLSLGEQDQRVYKRWFDAGAHRYLLRIETTNRDLYRKIHPYDNKHDFRRRLDCLKSLQHTGYQTGTGVMIGLPFQTFEDLADDLIFMRLFNIDMCGMGPYIEHADTPMIEYSHLLLPLSERLDLSLKMIALIRIIMKDINIVASTALQAIDPLGREKALNVGANIVMPNITPSKYRCNYKLYNNKPGTDNSYDTYPDYPEESLSLADTEIIYREWGDSKHYERRHRG